MVRVPGSFGDSGFHRESEDDVPIKLEPGDQASTEVGSTTTLLNQARPADQLSFGRNSADVKEEGLTDLEEKPQPPPQAPSGAPASSDANWKTSDGDPSTKVERSPSPTPPSSSSSKKKRAAKPKTTRKKMKAPESDAEDQVGEKSVWTNDQLEQIYNRKRLQQFLVQDPVMIMLRLKLLGDLSGPVATPPRVTDQLGAIKAILQLLKEAGISAGAFEADDIFDLELDVITKSLADLFHWLKRLVGEMDVKAEDLKISRINATECHTGSSHYASATSEAGSVSSEAPKRMTLGPSGASMLQDRKVPVTMTPRAEVDPTAGTRPDPTDKMETFFQAAMGRFLKEQQSAAPPKPVDQLRRGERDVEMESVTSLDHNQHWEYDPDELEVAIPKRAAVATTTTAGVATSVPRIRISAISDLKSFTGKDTDDDRARAWLSTVKSTFVRDQAPEEEKCLVFGDLFTGPARNWYRQLSRTTRSTWTDLLREFQTQYCGLGISLAWQYYHARKRSDESPLQYLHRLNVAGMRARLQVKDGSPAIRREHVNHFIETLDERELADQLTLLRLPDAMALEDVLQARERAKGRQGKSAQGSAKFRQKPPTTTPKNPVSTPKSANTRAVRAIQIREDSSESEEGSGSSEEENELRRIFATATAGEGSPPPTGETQSPDRSKPERETHDHPPSDHVTRKPDVGAYDGCSHCGSRKHTNLGCWKRLTCQKCGKKGHPSDRCLFVCRGCGELHDIGKCPMEEFYNMIRQWYQPTKHAGMLPAEAEKMLN